MPSPSAQELKQMHGRFAASSSNQAYAWIGEQTRSPLDEEAMLAAAHASFWHWSQRDDFAPRYQSVAYWQLARAYALVGAGALAQRYAQRCIEVSEAAPLPPLFVAYGYEASARAHWLAGELLQARAQLARAASLTQQVESDESRSTLQRDVDELLRVLTPQ